MRHIEEGCGLLAGESIVLFCEYGGFWMGAAGLTLHRFGVCELRLGEGHLFLLYGIECIIYAPIFNLDTSATLET